MLLSCCKRSSLRYPRVCPTSRPSAESHHQRWCPFRAPSRLITVSPAKAMGALCVCALFQSSKARRLKKLVEKHSRCLNYFQSRLRSRNVLDDCEAAMALEALSCESPTKALDRSGKKLLRRKGIATRSKDAPSSSNKKLLGKKVFISCQKGPLARRQTSQQLYHHFSSFSSWNLKGSSHHFDPRSKRPKKDNEHSPTCKNPIKNGHPPEKTLHVLSL